MLMLLCAKWNVPSILNLNPTTKTLPKFKGHLPKFSGNGTIFVMNI